MATSEPLSPPARRRRFGADALGAASSFGETRRAGASRSAAAGSAGSSAAMSAVLRSAELLDSLAPCLAICEVVALRAAAVGMGIDAPVSLSRRSFELYICGGSHVGADDSTCSAEYYSASQGVWETLPPMRHRRAGAAATAIHGRIYVCGGGGRDSGECQVLRSAERFDTVLRRWEALPDMLLERRSASAAAIGGQLYICGGEGGEHGEVILSSAERFDPSAWRWEPLPAMEGHRFGAAAATLSGCLYIAGGSIGLDALSSAERFNVERHCWESLPEMLERRHGATGVAAGGYFYVLGGSSAERNLRSAERFSIGKGRLDGNTWESLPELPLPEGFCLGSGAADGAGRLLLLGGQRESGTCLRCVNLLELLQPPPPPARGAATGAAAGTTAACAVSWRMQPLPPMLHARCLSAVARLLL
eukprot:TRINITY_DN24007_c0_g2_i1.p1 TRINITY_DN24007_c0_g2~~TRINITY_DN24007_c0_g2_i1.p1  ORF type:complete len:433 (+),score=101.07 TRINITY_DN24007_c0_g2_i1:40-1299(+)